MKKIIRKLKHYFLAHKGNDFRAEILKDASLCFLLSLVLIIFFAGMAHRVVLNNSSFLANIYSGVLVDLANEDRGSEALQTLTVSPVLEEAARMKAEDMAAKGYFAHYGPDGSSPWDWMRKAGYKFIYAGENLAIDFTDSEDVNEAWLKSPTHRANILNSKFTEIGIATVKGEYNGRETVFVVQMFGTPIAKASSLPVSVTPVPVNQLTQESPAEVSPTVSGASVEKTQTLKPPAPKQVAVASETKPAAPQNQTENLTNEESLITTENPEVNPAENIQSQNNPNSPSPVLLAKKVGTNPYKTIEAIYAFLGLAIVISLIGMIRKDLQFHHLKHAFGGVTLLVIIISLGYIYKMVVYSHAVIVAMN